MFARTRIIPVGLVLLFSLCFAGVASAQYFERAQPAYLPEPARSTDLTLSRAGSESGFYSQGPPPARIGIAFDFGVGWLQNKRLDRDFFAMNNAPTVGTPTSLAYDVTIYGQFMDSFRVGLNVGALEGGRTARDISMLRVGANLEAGRRFYTGWGIWAGAHVGWGRGRAETETIERDIFRHQSTGIALRGMVRFERELAPFITLRLTPFVETLVRTNEWYEEDVLASRPPSHFPDETRGNFVGYGVMLGVALHSF